MNKEKGHCLKHPKKPKTPTNIFSKNIYIFFIGNKTSIEWNEHHVHDDEHFEHEKTTKSSANINIYIYIKQKDDYSHWGI